MDFSESQQIKIKSKIRHSEYYNLIDTFDKLYYDSTNNKIFYNLTNLIISDKNILLAYRNIKKNTGSTTRGSDNRTIKDIEKLSQDEYKYVNLYNSTVWGDTQLLSVCY